MTITFAQRAEKARQAAGEIAVRADALNASIKEAAGLGVDVTIETVRMHLMNGDYEIVRVKPTLSLDWAG